MKSYKSSTYTGRIRNEKRNGATSKYYKSTKKGKITKTNALNQFRQKHQNRKNYFNKKY